MATDSEILARIERQQLAIIQGVSGLADVVSITNAMIAEMMDWLKTPPSSDLPDTIKMLAAQVVEMRAAIDSLPKRVAKAVIDGKM